MTFDASELRTLAADFDSISSAALPHVRSAYKEGAERLAEGWRANAKETSGVHGKHYPSSITWQEMLGGNINFEIGPETRKKQGSMGPGFEYGSINQEPHLDGNRAADKLGPVIERMVADSAEELF